MFTENKIADIFSLSFVSTDSKCKRQNCERVWAAKSPFIWNLWTVCSLKYASFEVSSLRWTIWTEEICLKFPFFNIQEKNYKQNEHFWKTPTCFPVPTSGSISLHPYMVLFDFEAGDERELLYPCIYIFVSLFI